MLVSIHLPVDVATEVRVRRHPCLLSVQSVPKLAPDIQSDSNQVQNMKTHIIAIALAAFTLALTGSAWSADTTVAGRWKGQFDSQIGLQKYTYEFKVDGTNLTGRAIGERQVGTNNVAITEGKIKQDEISFVEPETFQGMELRVEYTGKVSGDEIKFHRKVGDFAEEDFVAKRVKEAEPKAEVKSEARTGTNSLSSRPQ